MNPQTRRDPSQPQATPRERAWLASLLWREDGRWLGRMAAWYDRLRRLGRRQRRWLARRAAVTLAGAALLLALSQSPALSQLPATSSSIDVVDGEVAIVENGKCSLMEAIINARHQSNPQRFADCAPGDVDGPDTVNLPPGGSFQLTEPHNSQYTPTGLPVITSEVIIEGNGATIARRGDPGDPEFRLMAVDLSGDLTVRDLTLRDAYTTYFGAGIFSKGTLRVERSTITGNHAYIGGGGIVSQGDLTVIGSTISLNDGYNGGGGIVSSGTATIHSTAIVGNSSQYYGGALTNYGVMTVTNSTISGNITGEEVAGIVNAGTLTLNNSTVTGNECWYSGFGGIYNSVYGAEGTLILNRSIVAGNYSTYGFDYYFPHEEIRGGIVVADNYNILGFDGDPGGFTPGPTDLVPAGDLDTILDRVRNNGGDTLTNALPPGSPAIDFAPGSDCAAPPVGGQDQRGFPRNVDGDGTPSSRECDAGAFERQPAQTATPTPTLSPTPSPTGTPTMTPQPSVTPSPTAGVTATGTPLATRTPTVTPSATPSPTATATRDPSETATPTATVLPTADPTASPTATATRRPFDHLVWLPVIR